MLGKVLKYDLKFGKNAFLGMASLIIALGIILRILDITPVSADYDHDALVAILLICTTLASAIISIMLVYQNYHRSLFTSEGYLMFTLPVKRSTLLTSKILTSLIWFNVMMLAAIVSVLILGGGELLRSLGDRASQLPGLFFPRALLLNLITCWGILLIFLWVSLANITIGRRRVGSLLALIPTVLVCIILNLFQNHLAPLITGDTAIIQNMDSLAISVGNSAIIESANAFIIISLADLLTSVLTIVGSIFLINFLLKRIDLQ